MHKSNQAHRRPRLRPFVAECLALGGLLAIAGCHAPPKPPVVVQPALPLPPPPAPPAPPLPRPAAPVHTNWSFAIGSAGCVAQATGEAGGFWIAVQSDGAVDFTVSDGAVSSLPLAVGTEVGVSFRGPAGSWTVPGKVQGGAAIQARVSGGDEALGMVLAVLGGGSASAGGAALALPEIEVPPAGTPGSKWFNCARNREHG